MPRVSAAAPVRLAAPLDAVREAARAHLGATEASPTSLVVTPSPGHQPELTTTIKLAAEGDETTANVLVTGTIDIPFFSWFFAPLVAIARRRQRRYVLDVLRASADGTDGPSAPKPVAALPAVAFAPEQAILLAAASAAVAVASFAAALFGQLAGPISDAFHASDARISLLLAITRIGALIALPVTALADRRGRRRAILIGIAGSAIVCAVSAIAPNLAVFTTAQVFQRGLLITTVTVAGIAVIEESPEGARAYSASMLALAGGLGFSIAVVVLPLADLGNWGWRIPFALGALSILLTPSIARHLSETTRYVALSARTDIERGRVRDIFRFYRRRFFLLAAASFLTSMFSAPSSQLMNKYLTDDRGFSNTGVALFRSVTTAVPGLVGLVLGGRLAEAKGRKPVAAVALGIATVTQMIFFLASGATIWFMSAISILAASASGIALGTLDAELFPTETRGTSNALLTVIAVVGSAAGFGIAGGLSDPLGSLGRSIALTGIAALIAAVAVVPMLPESAAQSLDEISPTHMNAPDEYRPDP